MGDQGDRNAPRAEKLQGFSSLGRRALEVDGGVGMAAAAKQARVAGSACLRLHARQSPAPHGRQPLSHLALLRELPVVGCRQDH
jgi:hypothetical protein